VQSLDLDEGGSRGGDAWSGEAASSADPEPAELVDDSLRVYLPGGPFSMGTDDRTRAYDNERNRHEVSVAAFDMERYPVTNRRWTLFMDDGGYQRPELWSAEGNLWRAAPGRDERPQGWGASRAGRTVRRFGEEDSLLPDEPVQHVCYWEAEAFARWCGGRLPTEAEWEKAAAWDPETAAQRP
jgi:iron(II)-dependent oxidoreductase